MTPEGGNAEIPLLQWNQVEWSGIGGTEWNFIKFDSFPTI